MQGPLRNKYLILTFDPVEISMETRTLNKQQDYLTLSFDPIETLMETNTFINIREPQDVEKKLVRLVQNIC